MGKMFVALVAAVMIVTAIDIAGAATTATTASSRELKGKLITISLDVDKAKGARFFTPKDITDVRGSETHRYYRYAQLKKGDRYGITLRLNNPSVRYRVCIAVDGRNVIDGKKVPDAVEKASSWDAGYVLNVDESGNGGTIKGWHESLDSVRQFVVTCPQQSLAGQWGDLSATGTIVIAVFKERVLQVSSKGTTRGGLGTGHGVKIESKVEQTTFDERPIASEVFVIKYETCETLKKLGIWYPESKPEKNRFWPEPEKEDREFIDFPD